MGEFATSLGKDVPLRKAGISRGGAANRNKIAPASRATTLKKQSFRTRESTRENPNVRRERRGERGSRGAPARRCGRTGKIQMSGPRLCALLVSRLDRGCAQRPGASLFLTRSFEPGSTCSNKRPAARQAAKPREPEHDRPLPQRSCAPQGQVLRRRRVGRRRGHDRRQEPVRRQRRRTCPEARRRRDAARDRGRREGAKLWAKKTAKERAAILRKWFALMMDNAGRPRAHHDRRAGQAAGRVARRDRLRRLVHRILRRGSQAHLRRDDPLALAQRPHARDQAAARASSRRSRRGTSRTP